MSEVELKVVAHRGGPREMDGLDRHQAELTMPAYERAVAIGADALECDVRLTSDNELVLFHDRTLARVAGSDDVVSHTPFAKLRESVPSLVTMRELLTLVADTERRVELAIETKHPVRTGGLVEEELAALLDEFGWNDATSPVRVMSFQHSAVRRMRKLMPKLPLVHLFSDAAYWKRVNAFVSREWSIGPGVELLRSHPEIAAWARARGQQLHVWTVNNEADFEYCLSLGMGTVITDRPQWAMSERSRLAP